MEIAESNETSPDNNVSGWRMVFRKCYGRGLTTFDCSPFKPAILNQERNPKLDASINVLTEA
jgi:hypothetical protein